MQRLKRKKYIVQCFAVTPLIHFEEAEEEQTATPMTVTACLPTVTTMEPLVDCVTCGVWCRSARRDSDEQSQSHWKIWLVRCGCMWSVNRTANL